MRPPLALALVVLGLAPAAASAGAVEIPAGWSAVSWPMTTTTVPAQRFAAASFPLRRTPPTSCGLSTATRAQIPPGGVIVTVLDWGPHRSKEFRPLSRPGDLGHPQRYECFGWSYDVPFRAAGHDLQAFVNMRGRPGPAHLNQVRRLLASFGS
jgi:hypothetical protein